MKKILIINPISTNVWNQLDKEYFSKNARKDIEVEVKSLESGPISIESIDDEKKSIPGILNIVEKNKEEYHAFIIDCFLDPAIEKSKKIFNGPVIGPGSTSYHMASLIGDKFGVISTGIDASNVIKEKVSQAGFEEKFVGTVPINIGVNELLENKKKTVENMVTAGRKLIDDMGAEVLILGCTGLVGFADKLQSIFNIPIIEPAIVSLKMAEILIDLNF
ncbi:aspartate/glutamate racemase family protein [Anaerosalibacter bizertensis]|uniref:aspartate/glutamate racemase family protein n=1 Tax=Anaerosalibacter bizertensis TaxID=932217 RepID=UPI001D01BFC0|nr:aspartate/glutamate racemase family protein [Anaerosalibacter bizertensis]MBV1820312.1 aspartate/glutamate racemase family protein [Bacteroidales bacterium MSK.15.36]MCB5559133.1 aspartate/glutamate racemase family protein [Anaerosalibacter bizertensis]MCG4585330.1 aspartate/glutamate racemase family protein [Anaerosalibacter bizertensis]